MKEYIITDGKQFFKKDITGKNHFTYNRVLADRVSIIQGKNIMNNFINRNLRGRFYIEELREEDCNPIRTKAGIREEIKEFEATEDMFKEIDDFVGQIATLNVPSLQTLNSMKEKLSEAQSYYDMVNSDIYHFMGEYTPPAYVRTKVYTIGHQEEKSRGIIKERLRCVKVLIDAIENNWNLLKLSEGLGKVKGQSYQGRTRVYDELLKLVKKEEVKIE